jgi:hypothetical protein
MSLTPLQQWMRERFVFPAEKAVAKAGGSKVQTTWYPNVADLTAELPGKRLRITFEVQEAA